MKNLFSLLILTILTNFPATLKAFDTWNEPWQKEILEKADYFVLGKILESNETEVKVHILQNFSDLDLEIDIIIDDFYLLNMVKSSGAKPYFKLKKDSYYYFFLKKNSNGNYSLPTPTSGYAYMDEDFNVSATYRISFDQAVIPQEIYEFSYVNIWNYFKYKKFDKRQVNDFLDYYLTKEPAGFDKKGIEVFYHQHVALEMAYLLDLTPKFHLVEKFAESENFHSRISALQLMGNYNSKDAKNYLLNSLTDERFNDFEKVIAIWAIKKIGDQKIINQVRELKDELSDETKGFGVKNTDPRSGTYFPSPKEAASNI